MMNAAENWASENWEALLRGIPDYDRKRSCISLYFYDSDADRYDFSNEILMREMCRRLVEALRTSWTQPQFNNYELRFGNMFFATMSEEQQRGFLRAICALPLDTLHIGGSRYTSNKTAINIHTSALLDALPVLNRWFRRLHLYCIDLSKEPDVEALSKIVVAKQQRIDGLELINVESPMNFNKQDEYGAVGCLDPLLYAASCLKQLDFFSLSSTRMPPDDSSLVSPKALSALVSTVERMEEMRLNRLGLNDSHCLVIRDVFLQSGYWRPGGIWQDELDLMGNPDITDEGYSAFLSLINRVNSVRKFSVDDVDWEDKLNLVSQMNRDYGRLEYMTNGTFTSERHRLQWLQKLASLPSSSNEEDAKQVNFIWYELLEHPEFMRT